MKLSEVRIENFRSIKFCHLFLDEITAVIGENNAGKTALLRALNSVFNWEYEKDGFLNNTHQYAARTTTKITLTFEDVSPRDLYLNKMNGDILVLCFKYSYGATTRKRTLSCLTPDAEYKNEANQHNPVINAIWDSPQSKADLSLKLKESYSKLFEFCATNRLYPMQYCLEMDLVASKESRSAYCRVMNVSDDDSAYKALLVDRCDAIKEPDKVLQVLEVLTPAQYPYSYKKIRNAIAQDINDAF